MKTQLTAAFNMNDEGKLKAVTIQIYINTLDKSALASVIIDGVPVSIPVEIWTGKEPK